jgi:short-subunit dehydrogenase
MARRQDRLDQLAAELSTRHGIDVRTSAADLADPATMERAAELIAQRTDLEYLVNNAGFGIRGRFFEADIQPQLEMIRLHVLATVRLTRAALPGMIERNRGALINVSSVAAWLTGAGSVQYAATKAYLNSFSESLQDELRETNVQVQALCPGFTYTEFHDRESMKGFERSMVAKRLWMSAEEVVDYSLSSLEGGKVIVVPGWRNRLLVHLLRSRWLKPLLLSAARFKARKK